MTTTIKAANAGDLLALIPRMLGYQPEESIVMIPFEGSRSLGAMRFDIPGVADDVAHVASTIAGFPLRVPGVNAVVVIAYTAGTVDSTGPILTAIVTQLERMGLRIADVLFVTGEGWGSTLDPHATVHPMSELEVPAGTPDLPVVSNQSAGASLPELTAEYVDKVHEVLGAIDQAVTALTGQDSSEPDIVTQTEGLTAVAALADLPTYFNDLVESTGNLSPEDAAILVWCMARPSLRDVGIVTWSGSLADGDEAFDAQLAWENGEEYPVHLAMRLWGEAEQPSPARLERGLVLARTAAAAAPTELAAGALSMAAWCSWALGRSTHAEVYANLAIGAEPEHGLSEIVLSFILAGHLPAWAFHKRGA